MAFADHETWPIDLDDTRVRWLGGLDRGVRDQVADGRTDGPRQP